MINRVVLIGRLTKDPELRKTQSGTSVVSYTIAVNRRSQTPGQPDADFINCVAWNKTAELMAQYLHKGSLIGVEGRIQTRSYDNQQGQRVYVTEVVTDSVQFLEPKNTQPQQNSYNSYNSYSQPAPAPVNPYAAPADNSFSSAFDADDMLDIASDDLPF